MTGRVVYHVDDSMTACKMFADALRAIHPELELKQFRSAQALIDSLSAETTPPRMIFSDHNMPGMTGRDLLSWVKRHPKFHFVPFILVTAEMDALQIAEAQRGGAFGYASKPLDRAEIAGIYDRAVAQEVDPEQWRNLDQTLATELLDMVDEMHDVARELNEQRLKELYRLFHTIKGNAYTYQFPALGDFMHTGENFLNAIQTGKLYTIPKVRELVTSVLGFIESQAEQLKAGMLMNLPRADLTQSLELLKANVDAGWLIPQASPSSPSAPRETLEPAPEKAGEHTMAKNGLVSRTAVSVRITNDRLDGLQQKFKRIIQVKMRLSSYASQLRSEFADEAFPLDLTRMVEELGTVSSDIMEFFIMLRVIPAARLRTFCTKVMAQTTEKLGKIARLEFDCEQGMEIDVSVLEALEGALTHVLRNSLDHGIEKPDERSRLGKDQCGLLRIMIRPLGKEQMSIVIEDDGKGIDAEKLKTAVLSKNLISADALNRLPPEQIYDLIFVDGLSTKENVSEVSGRGVGLAAAKANIVKLGGTIRVESTLGQGTRTSIQVPRFFRL